MVCGRFSFHVKESFRERGSSDGWLPGNPMNVKPGGLSLCPEDGRRWPLEADGRALLCWIGHQETRDLDGHFLRESWITATSDLDAEEGKTCFVGTILVPLPEEEERELDGENEQRRVLGLVS
jgi:hypothetical protein